MTFPRRTLAEWRSRVERELGGRPIDRVLAHETLEGIAVEPLYIDAPALPRLLGDGAGFRICMRHEADTTRDAVSEDLDGGADALWLPREATACLPVSLPPHVLVLIDDGDACTAGGERAGLVSTLAFHLEGADACDEIALALSTAVARLGAGAERLLVRVAAGRDTFVELCKLRALRLCLRKVLAAYGGSPLPFRIHAVASSRTVTARDPWVNLLRVTTQAFAAVLGGADLVTPLPFDEALASRSALGRRIARNTGHVLREEGGLGRVVDPAAGSYGFDTLTDALARGGWERFRDLERRGGLGAALASGHVRTRLGATRSARRDLLARRRLAVVGVSEFANLAEVLPGRPRTDDAGTLRDGADFEGLRARAEALPPGRAEVVLVTLGSFAESRPRVEFAASLFAAGGLRARELGPDEPPPPGGTACLCGSDERYASEAAERARELRAAGVRHLLLAGRPGPLEPGLRDAGVDTFVFAGCDAVAVLETLLEVAP